MTPLTLDDQSPQFSAPMICLLLVPSGAKVVGDVVGVGDRPANQD